MNKVILMGRLTRDPEVRYSSAAEPIAIARYGLAVNRRFKRPNEPDVDFIDCVAFRKDAEFAEKYFKKGMMVAVCGRLQISSWDDKETGQKRTRAEVVLDEQNFAESKASFEGRVASGGGDYQPRQSAPPPKAGPRPAPKDEGFFAIEDSLDDEDLPF